MDTNLAAWMISGGPRIEILGEQRDREQLHAYRESQRVPSQAHHGLIDRLWSFVRPTSPEADLACCPA